MLHFRPMKRILILRLSSLGDVILSSAALEVERLSHMGIDWVVAPEFSEPLQGHPKISSLIVFERKTGLRGWFRLCRRLWQSNYAEVLDLHVSLRTWIMRFLFWIWGRGKGPEWRLLSKQR